MSESEVWKDITGYEGLYQVSNKGNIYSVERRDSMGRECGGRTLTPKTNPDGYLRIALCKNGTTKQYLIHRLVTQAFIPNPNNYLEINHKDEDKSNNDVENLEWCTRKYNINFGTGIERATQKQSKKVKAINIKTGEVLTFDSAKEAGNKGYARLNVNKACGGVYKNINGTLVGGDGHTYRGHKWSYE